MSDLIPAPSRIAQMVNGYVRTERAQVERYDNREHLDASALYDLHALARSIYAAGWTDGYIVADEVQRGNRP